MRLSSIWSICLSVLAAVPASASFHLMQIEQAIGGVCGDVSAQAVQLRLRANGQNQVQGQKLFVYDAEGTNEVELMTFGMDAPNGAAGVRILIATQAFVDATGIPADFLMADPIPTPYLAAGQLSFESAGGIVYWSLAWGGEGFSGSTMGQTTNDDDGDFGPAWPGSLPSSSNMSLAFVGSSGDQSTTNEDDYALSASPTFFENNLGTSAPLPACLLFEDGFESGDTTSWTTSTP